MERSHPCPPIFRECGVIGARVVWGDEEQCKSDIPDQFYKGMYMKIYSSLKSKKIRDKDCQIVRRKNKVYVINKKNPKLKARQG